MRTLYIFTDGSVKDFIGEYGAIAIKWKNYKDIITKKLEPKKWLKEWRGQTTIGTNSEYPIFTAKAETVSCRTSIGI